MPNPPAPQPAPVPAPASGPSAAGPSTAAQPAASPPSINIIMPQQQQQKPPSTWSKLWGGAKAAGGLAAGAASSIYTNTSSIGLAGILILAIEAFNVFTQYSNFPFRIFSGLLIIGLLVFIGMSIPLATLVAVLDFLVPSFLINFLIQKSPPAFLFFLNPLVSLMPVFPDFAQTALTVLIAAFAPALVAIFIVINVKVDTSGHGGFNIYKFTRAIYVIIIIFALGAFFFSSAAWAGVDFAKPIAEVATLTPQGRETVSNAWKMIINSPQIVTEGANKLFQQTVQVGIGGDYYAGQVEQTKNKPAGVVISKFEAENPNNIIENQKTYFFGSINVITLPSKNITITTSCAADSPDQSKPPIIGETSPKQFAVDLRGTETVQCLFTNGLPKGARPVNITADFEFATESYNRAYFMNRDRLVALSQEDVDPYTLFPVPERTPQTVYTPGPVAIGMKVNNPIGVTTSTSVAPQTIGVTISSNWKGKITGMKSIYLYVPLGIRIKPGDCGSFDFVLDSAQSDISGYSKYRLQNAETLWETLRDNDYNTFNCHFEFYPDETTVLKNEQGSAVPLATKFFFVNADYTFSLSSQTNAVVRPAPQSTQIVP